MNLVTTIWAVPRATINIRKNNKNDKNSNDAPDDNNDTNNSNINDVTYMYIYVCIMT